MADALYLTAQGLLQGWLLAAVRTCSERLGIAPSDATIRPDRQTELSPGMVSLPGETCRGGWIPLHRDRNNLNIVYLSAIALKLAPEWQLPGSAIARHLIEQLSIQGLQHPSDLHQYPDLEVPTRLKPGMPLPAGFEQHALDFQLTQPAPGLIRLQLSEPGIAAWLSYLLQTRPPPVCQLEMTETSPFLNPTPTDSTIFSIQYSHARCWALMRLAFQVGLWASPFQPSTQVEAWYQLAEFPFPWLDDRHQLHLAHPSERQLISQLFKTVDRFDPCNSNSFHALVAFKVARDLSQAFQTFYQCCQIFGEVQRQTPHLAQTRMGLVVLVQSWLQQLLQGKLKIFAPIEI